MVEWIIFDWGGVMGESNNKAAARMLSQKFHVDRDKLLHAFADPEDDYADGSKDPQGYYEHAATLFSIPVEEIKSSLLNVPAWQSSIDLVRSLHERKKWSLALLSNQLAPRTEAIKKSNDLNIFDYVFFSNEIGFAKPDPAIYWYVLERIKAKPENCLFIDDRFDNIETAKALGMRSIHFESHDQLVQELRHHGVDVD